MPITLTMPALSPTMSEGKIARWLKKEGDRVEPGEVLAEIETDKATVEFEAVDEGTLGRILVPEGAEGVKVGTPIALLLEEGEDSSALEGLEVEAKAGPEPTTTAPAAAPRLEPEVAAAVAERPAGVEERRIFASPLAKRIAREAGIDLAGIRGSGPHGRIVKADVERAIEELRRAPERPPAAAPEIAPAPAAAFAPSPGMRYVEIPLSNMRKIIARRLTEAKQQIPHFYLTVDCRLDRLLDVRRELNARLGEEAKISVNDFLIKAVALAIRDVPDVNVTFGGDRLYRYEDIDISVAVATPGGLITPIVRRADEKGLATIAREMKDLASRAREGRLRPEEYQGGGFTISNLGMYGIRQFEAVINPPQACILAVGMGERRPLVEDDRVVIATVMTVTLSVDHRAVDGALGAEFLKAFRGYVEQPLTLLL